MTKKEISEIETCPHCKKREATIDDMGFLGCQRCWDTKISLEVKNRMRQHAFDMDGTGQDEEAWEESG
jgi:hypothetical protein